MNPTKLFEEKALKETEILKDDFQVDIFKFSRTVQAGDANQYSGILKGKD